MEEILECKFQFMVRKSDKRIVMAGYCDFTKIPSIKLNEHDVVIGNGYRADVMSGVRIGNGFDKVVKIWNGTTVETRT